MSEITFESVGKVYPGWYSGLSIMSIWRSMMVSLWCWLVLLGVGVDVVADVGWFGGDH